jgi:prolyl oligopeptidase
MLPFLSVVVMAAELEDPYLWLEEVQGERALAFVHEQNAASTGELMSKPLYAEIEGRLRAIYDSKDRIPYVEEIGGRLYNLWQDAEHPRGLWRRTSWEEYAKSEPAWETVIDLDALSAKDGQSWVWHGASCLPPAWDRCLVSLSPGGSDADVTREFSLATGTFVDGGFALPEAKGGASWVDQDHVFVSLAQGPGTETTSGYPRQVRLWTRGTPLSEAKIVFEGQETDVSVGGYKDLTAGFEREIVYRSPTFYTQETFLREGDALVRLDVPEDANASLWREWLIVELRSPWQAGGATHPAGSLVAAKLDAFKAGSREMQVLFTPTDATALSGMTVTRHHLVLNILDNVRSRIEVLTPGEAAFTRRPVDGLPEFASISVSPVDAETSDEVFLTITDFVTPTTLSLVDLAKSDAPKTLKSLPAYFDAKGLMISQHFATSKDGTKIPYFQVSKKSVKPKGKAPTLLYGYGGFEVSLTPSYNAGTGAAWLEKGGVYVLANIRGGGEFGPRWHQAALKEHRHRAYEDFAAVADDLVRRRVTTPEHLGAMGGSNGGLLMGNMLTQYPDRFGAIVCQVPLLDMRRYHTLLAGASWMGEYGNPDEPAEWSFIQGFSPYHLVKSDGKYPRTFFVTSTKDDRVHPGHARKMVARMKEMGHDVVYWENVEGGHGGAATNADRAKMWALSFTFLWETLR